VQLLNTARSVQLLRKRIAELEKVEGQLLASQVEVKQLHHRLRMTRQDSHFIESMKEKILRHDELERQVQLLQEENASLRQDRANADLLRYKVQSLQQRCEDLEHIKQEAEQLRIENSQLKGGEMQGQHASISALQLHLTELQQREIVSISEQAELQGQ